ncbi:MAG: hypothetical protein U0324_14450 [Polyangiales bacterium]
MNLNPSPVARRATAFAIAALATFLALRPAPATAAWRRQSASAVCRVVFPVAPAYTTSAYDIRNSQAANYLQVLCPIVDSSSFMKEDYSAVTLSVTDNSSTLDVNVMACITVVGSVGGTCTSTAASTGTTFVGATTLDVNLGLGDHPWTSGTRSDLGYILVKLAPKDFTTGAESSFRGIYTVD